MAGDAPEPETGPGRRELWAAAMQERSRRLTERAERERRRHGSVDAVFEMADRDADVGGGIIAGALAYRLFIWMLPLALVLVGGLGIAAEAAEETPEEAADSLGMALARILGIADRLLDESKDWLWLGGRMPDMGDRVSSQYHLHRRTLWID